MKKRVWSSCENHSRIFRGAQKSGMSAIVATVLVVLIVVVTVGVVWGLVLPVVQDGVETEISDVRISIDTGGGYTFFNESTGEACVQVRRSSDNTNLVRIDVIFSFGGDTFVGNFTGAEIPGANEANTECFDLSDFTNEDGSQRFPDSVELSPIFLDGGREVVGSRTPKVVKIKNGTSVGVDSDPQRIDDGEDDEVDNCRTLDVAGGEYRLVKDIISDSTCFIIVAEGISLDLNGFNITGEGDGYGVSVEADGATVKNGEIYSFNNGIYLNGVSGNNLMNINVESSYGSGIYLVSSSNNNLTAIVSNSNGADGISFSGSSGNILRDSTTNSNGARLSGGGGVMIFGGSNNILMDLISVYNQGSSSDGIYIMRSHSNVLLDINASYNGQVQGGFPRDNKADGVQIKEGNSNNLTRVIAMFNGHHGLYFEGKNDESLIVSSLVADSTFCDNNDDIVDVKCKDYHIYQNHGFGNKYDSFRSSCGELFGTDAVPCD